MLTSREKELIETIREQEDDFYAPLLGLALSRYARVEDHTTINHANLVVGCYKDLHEA